jgi:hypothetical protein
MTNRTKLSVEALEDRSVPSSFTTVMTGLDNPRFLAFGPEGGLYVAEAGRGGDGPSIEIRPGVFASYGPSGAVSRLWHGEQERVATGLPSLLAPDGATGPHGISFQGRGNAYVTVGWGTDPTRRSELGEVGAGFAQLVRLLPNGNWQNVSDLGAYEAAADPDGDGLLDSNLFGLLAEAGGQVVVDAGGNSLLRVAANGKVSTLAAFPAADGTSADTVPTGVTVGPDGAYYVGALTGVPFPAGAANIYRVVPGEAPQIVYTGFKAVIDLDFGPDGSLYVLQHATGPFLSGNGSLIRVAPDGTRTPIEVEGLALTRPTSVLVGGDGTIYVTNHGIEVGTGEVIRITLGPAEGDSVVGTGGSAQRSMVNGLTAPFGRAVPPDAGAFALLRQGGGWVGLNVATSAVPTFAVPGIIGGALADDDGSAAGDRTGAFVPLFGGRDGDRDGDWVDRDLSLSAFGKSIDDAAYRWFFDFDGDRLDNGQFNHRFGQY